MPLANVSGVHVRSAPIDNSHQHSAPRASLSPAAPVFRMPCAVASACGFRAEHQQQSVQASGAVHVQSACSSDAGSSNKHWYASLPDLPLLWVFGRGNEQVSTGSGAVCVDAVPEHSTSFKGLLCFSTCVRVCLRLFLSSLHAPGPQHVGSAGWQVFSVGAGRCLLADLHIPWSSHMNLIGGADQKKTVRLAALALGSSATFLLPPQERTFSSGTFTSFSSPSATPALLP